MSKINKYPCDDLHYQSQYINIYGSYFYDYVVEETGEVFATIEEKVLGSFNRWGSNEYRYIYGCRQFVDKEKLMQLVVEEQRLK